MFENLFKNLETINYMFNFSFFVVFYVLSFSDLNLINNKKKYGI